MKPWDQLLPLVLPFAPGCPDLIAEEEIRNAAEEFFDRSKAWRVWTADQDTIANQADYLPTLPANTRLVKLIAAKLDGLDLGIDDSEGDVSTGLPLAAYTYDMANVTLWPAPTSAGQKLKVNLALTITSAATGLDDNLFNAYRLQIADGAIARLAAHEDKPYSNPGKAGMHGGKFNESIDKAKTARTYGNSTQRKRVKLHTM